MAKRFHPARPAAGASMAQRRPAPDTVSSIPSRMHTGARAQSSASDSESHTSLSASAVRGVVLLSLDDIRNSKIPVDHDPIAQAAARCARHMRTGLLRTARPSSTSPSAAGTWSILAAPPCCMRPCNDFEFI
ncbi:hypothetical protein M407DRAFT_18365 [Tulasnella calospora MUT 4182]|uniref:Uncharacterized protein n=1 Tax=Tulasnella calospora MUT 4182 TaxID=1051891 RepID=A0A0C3QVD4_9AGAM|nr:hypothetical protein M407DRAFT_18365 [Tulasnella calospora MUT 4182]